MALTPAEKQQVDTAIDAFLESPNAQAVITSFISGLETNGLKFADAVINNAHVGGVLGGVVNAFKGSAENELNTLAASMPPAALAMLATKAIEGEFKAVFG